MSNLHDNITFVLVRTRFASNLGSAVRAIRNMGFSRLVLVQPRCEVGMEARSYAMRGVDILDRAEFAPSLEAASELTGQLVGTSGAPRGGRPPAACRTFCETLLARLAASRVGIVFGPEDTGLSHDEAGVCEWLLKISTRSAYSSLNLAQAVAIVSYEMHVSLGSAQALPLDRARSGDITALLEAVHELLDQFEISRVVPAAKLEKRMRRLIGRATLERADTRMLMGILAQIRRQTGGSRRTQESE